MDGPVHTGVSFRLGIKRDVVMLDCDNSDGVEARTVSRGMAKVNRTVEVDDAFGDLPAASGLPANPRC
jgi:hypothetical protein